jgi:DNA polymerase IV
LDFIAHLPIESFWGVGPVTAQKMHALGIHNGTQLQACTLEMLTRQFGKAGNLYYDFARGIDLRPVEPIRIRKSVGCEHTLEKDISLHSSASIISLVIINFAIKFSYFFFLIILILYYYIMISM